MSADTTDDWKPWILQRVCELERRASQADSRLLTVEAVLAEQARSAAGRGREVNDLGDPANLDDLAGTVETPPAPPEPEGYTRQRNPL